MHRKQVLVRALAAVGLAPATPLLVHQASTGAHASPVVGSWFVLVQGAPFAQHLFVFHADGTMLQANPDAGDAHTSDSDGIGVWKGSHTVVGAFVEVNADRATHRHVSTLRVEFKIDVAGDTFTGPATATYYHPDGSVQAVYPASFKATRIPLPKE